MSVSSRKWNQSHPKEMWAQAALRSALKKGLIQRAPCEHCGAIHGEDGVIVDAHHPDYDRPMDVRWLCRLHHRRVHRIPISCEEIREAAE